ncbi:C-3 sterol dehydrogenase [Mycena metata]|uniref:C-3 sterol dehydrogenase n=1 Tax=Mycena metata TaxID=1033252 RepID=A0AAD7KFM1_9AGAR|nr:C-3 sterol dehydrogenase [Mycena metata]
MRDIYLVIGGSGFVGRHIVQQLLARGDTVSALDIVQRHHDVPFYSADITDQEQQQAVETGVRKLVFTSSAGVVFNGDDLIDVDERTPFPEKPMDAYTESKAKAEEAVLAANGKKWPAGIFGPGDQQAMAGLYQVYERGQTHFQIGDNTNLFDWTYVGNVAAAHLLAADRLTDPPPAPVLADLPEMPKSPEEVPPLTQAEDDLVQYALPSIDIDTGAHRPVVRTRFDPLSDVNIARTKLHAPSTSPLQVAGQAFFITNGEPCYFWDFARLVWHNLDGVFPEKAKTRKTGVWVLPKEVGMLAAAGAEWWGWLTGKDPTFTRFKVSFSCARRWYNIEKARRVLGYEPTVGIEEGVRLMVEAWKAQHFAQKR